MLEIKTSNDGSFDFAIDRLNLGYWSDSQKGSCIYYRNNSVYVGRGIGEDFYFNLQLHIGKMRIKIDI